MADLLKVKIKSPEGINKLYYVNGDVWKDKLEAAKTNPEYAKQVLKDIEESASKSRDDAILYSVDG